MSFKEKLRRLTADGGPLDRGLMWLSALGALIALVRWDLKEALSCFVIAILLSKICELAKKAGVAP